MQSITLRERARLVMAVSRLHQPELSPLGTLYLGIGDPLLIVGSCYFTALITKHKEPGVGDMKNTSYQR